MLVSKILFICFFMFFTYFLRLLPLMIRIYSFLLITISALGLWFFPKAVNAFASISFFTWISADVVVRLLLFFFLVFSWFFVLSLFKKLSTSTKLFLSVVLGIGCSFIRPIYVDDYVMNYSKNSSLYPEILSYYTGDTTLNDGYVVATFFTTSCTYCKTSATQLNITKQKNDKLKMIVCFPSTKNDVQQFFDQTNSSFEYVLMEQNTFILQAGRAFPSVFLLKNGVVENHWVGSEINYAMLDYLTELKN